MNLHISDTFSTALPADKDTSNSRRQVKGAAFAYVTPRVPSNPKLLHFSKEAAALLGLSEEDCKSDEFLKVFSGAEVLTGSKPYAMCYAGHQFGNWAGQLGDGRAINLAEVVFDNKRWAMQLKGSGETPFSRTADGLAVLRSSVREHLCSEAMFHLGVPTTRSLSLIETGDMVLRDVLYNGNPAYEKGAVVCRIAPSFVRFGNFEIFAARQDIPNLRLLGDYVIEQFYPEITEKSELKYVELLKAVAENTRKMIVEWQRVGFVHGVMNTDNMSILGLTIDYGPYGWLEGYDPSWTPNTTDRENRRYRFGNQPNIAVWNLFQLANALFPLVEKAEPLQEILEAYRDAYYLDYERMMFAKLGIINKQTDDVKLIEELENVLKLTETDFTIFFRNLSKIDRNTKLDADFWQNHPLNEAFYAPENLVGDVKTAWENFLQNYIYRIAEENETQRQTKMAETNPKYVLRNYMAQLAIDAADAGDYSVMSELHEILKKPYDEQPEAQKWFAKRPEWARVKVGCSMLSCSS
jgi:serine/tyrosine/threonine adenylyltransferase